MNKFKEAKAGDKLYSLRYGYVNVVENIESDIIWCKPQDLGVIAWMSNGKLHNSDITQDLYWDKPKIIEPKRKVKAYLYILNYGKISSYFYTDKYTYNCYGNRVDKVLQSVIDNHKKTDFYIEVEE